MLKKIFWLCFAILCLMMGLEIYDCLKMADYGTALPENLDFLCNQETFSEQDYNFIFSQTGLGKPAVDALKKESDDFKATLLSFQEQRFLKANQKRHYLFFPTTIADILEEDGNYRHLKLPPLETGDILITKSTKTLLYRHGHAAIVVDAGRGLVVEAMMLGVPSAITRTDGWEAYATLMVLRPKEKEKGEQAAEYAKTHLRGVPYHLLAGLFQKDKSGSESVDVTHCSHLVWQAYRAAGVELDSDGGWLVTPCDISYDSDLELVFAYGFGDAGKW